MISELKRLVAEAKKTGDVTKFTRASSKARAAQKIEPHTKRESIWQIFWGNTSTKKKVAALPNFTGRTFIQGALDARTIGFRKVKAVAGPKQPTVKIPSTTVSGTLKKSMEG